MAIEVHFEKRINNLNLVCEADTKYRREYIGVACLFGLFVCCMFFYGWQHYQWRMNGYKIEAAQKQKEQLTEVQHQLRLERESLRDLGRIDSIARRELGMVQPAPGQIVILNADTPLDIPGTQDQEQLAAKR